MLSKKQKYQKKKSNKFDSIEKHCQNLSTRFSWNAERLQTSKGHAPERLFERNWREKIRTGIIKYKQWFQSTWKIKIHYFLIIFFFFLFKSSNFHYPIYVWHCPVSFLIWKTNFLLYFFCAKLLFDSLLVLYFLTFQKNLLNLGTPWYTESSNTVQLLNKWLYIIISFLPFSINSLFFSKFK